MEYLFTIKNGTQVLDQEVSDLKETIKLVKQVIMALSDIEDKEADMRTMDFLQAVDEIGAQAISNADTGHKLVVQKHE